MDIVPLTLDRAPALDALFEASSSGCYCRWWHFDGNKNDWLARCFNEPRQNRDDAISALRSGTPDARGLMAVDGNDAVGWLKLAPRASLSKLVRQGPYRRLPLGSADGVWVVGCFLIHPARRRQGIARALLGRADSYVQKQGGMTLEAYPRRADRVLHAEEAWMGTVALFESCGFVEFAGEGPYPVMRKSV